MSKRKPTVLKLLEGNPGKRAINKNEPVPKNNLADPPEFLGDTARQMWTYILQEMPEGLIKSTDLAELTMWCVAFEIYKKAYEQVRIQGEVVITTERGLPMPVTNPYLKIMNDQALVLSRAGSNLGLNPVARSKMSEALGGPQNPTAPASQFIPRARK